MRTPLIPCQVPLVEVTCSIPKLGGSCNLQRDPKTGGTAGLYFVGETRLVTLLRRPRPSPARPFMKTLGCRLKNLGWVQHKQYVADDRGLYYLNLSRITVTFLESTSTNRCFGICSSGVRDIAGHQVSHKTTKAKGYEPQYLWFGNRFLTGPGSFFLEPYGCEFWFVGATGCHVDQVRKAQLMVTDPKLLSVWYVCL